MKRWGARVTLTLVAGFGTLLILEGSARAYFRWHHDGCGFRSSLLYVADPVLDYRINLSHCPPKTGRILGAPLQGDHPLDEPRVQIVALGGSMTWGHSNTDRSTWPAQLERWLVVREALAPRTVEVINGGVPGYGSRQIRLRFEREVVNVKPTLVIVDATWNGVGSVADPRAWAPENIAGHGARVGRRLATWLTTHSLLAAKSRWFKNPRETLPALAPVADIFREDLRVLARQAQAEQIQLVLLQAPAIWTLHGTAEESQLIEQLLPGQQCWEQQARANQALARQMIREVGQEFGVPIIDGAQAFEPLLPVERSTLFSDYMHLSDAGNALLASYIAAQVAPLFSRRDHGRLGA